MDLGGFSPQTWPRSTATSIGKLTESCSNIGSDFSEDDRKRSTRNLEIAIKHASWLCSVVFLCFPGVSFVFLCVPFRFPGFSQLFSLAFLFLPHNFTRIYQKLARNLPESNQRNQGKTQNNEKLTSTKRNQALKTRGKTISNGENNQTRCRSVSKVK